MTTHPCIPFLLAVAAAVPAADPVAVPTFNCVGLYWKADGGAKDNACAVRYRAHGEEAWREALPLWYDGTDHPKMAEHSQEYRGSIVGLKPGTAYEVELALAKGATAKVAVTTWNDQFKIARTVTIPADAKQPYAISEGGSATDGYVVYTAAPGTVFDGGNDADANIKVDASFVILRGLTLKNAKANGVVLGDVQDVVIEGCDISGWGRTATDCPYGVNLDSALYSHSEKLERIVIQDCQLHNPRSNSNSWTEERPHDGRMTKHPIGPQTISFVGGLGRYVVRRNKIWSDPQHKYNDTMGETHNFSYAGFPNRDSDVHDNQVANAYDDGIEMEGADMNVRVWGNRFDDVYGSVGCATSSLGPIYIFRNVMNSSRKGPKDDDDGNKGSYLVKIGNEDHAWGMGSIFIFHNTMLQPPARPGFTGHSGGNSGILFTSDKKQQSFITSRNNILYVRDETHPSIKDAQLDPTNDYDYDLCNGSVKAREGAEAHGLKGTPQFDTAKPGEWPLQPGTPGHDAGVRLPNFNDGFAGAAPDIGAFEAH